jgi:hypothetical protein
MEEGRRPERPPGVCCMTLSLRQVAHTKDSPKREGDKRYDGIDPLLMLTVRLFKENKIMRQMLALEDKLIKTEEADESHR